MCLRREHRTLLGEAGIMRRFSLSRALSALSLLLLISGDVAVAHGDAATVESARLSVTDIIAAAEKLQAGAIVLDVSFEPKDGQPVYAVRTYANDKVWDGLLDGTTGTAIDRGTVMDESALDAEDKAELAALKGAKITPREAIGSAEKAKGGRALNAGLEQVRGHAVWEILIQNTNIHNRSTSIRSPAKFSDG